MVTCSFNHHVWASDWKLSQLFDGNQIGHNHLMATKNGKGQQLKI